MFIDCEGSLDGDLLNAGDAAGVSVGLLLGVLDGSNELSLDGASLWLIVGIIDGLLDNDLLGVDEGL